MPHGRGLTRERPRPTAHHPAQEAAHEPDRPPAPARPVRHLHLRPPASTRFYQDLFGWPVNVFDQTYALAGDGGGQPTGGIGQAGPDSPYAGFAAYFPADDVDSALARAGQLGGTRVLAPADTPASRIAVFTDSDGNRVGLVSR
jgi:uncharacterized protein